MYIPGLATPMLLRRAAAGPLVVLGPPQFIAKGDPGNALYGTVTMTPSIPAGYQAGDIFLLFSIHYATTGFAGISAPGWTGGNFWSADNIIRVEILWRLATATETAPTVTCAARTDGAACVIAAYRNAHPTAPLESGQFLDGAMAGTFLAYGQINVLGINRVVLQMFGSQQAQNGVGTPGSGWTERTDLEVQSAPAVSIQVDEITQLAAGMSPAGTHLFGSTCSKSCRYAIALKPALE